MFEDIKKFFAEIPGLNMVLRYKNNNQMGKENPDFDFENDKPKNNAQVFLDNKKLGDTFINPDITQLLIYNQNQIDGRIQAAKNKKVPLKNQENTITKSKVETDDFYAGGPSLDLFDNVVPEIVQHLVIEQAFESQTVETNNSSYDTPCSSNDSSFDGGCGSFNSVD